MTSPLVTVSQRNPDTRRPHARDVWTQSSPRAARSLRVVTFPVGFANLVCTRVSSPVVS